MKSLLSLVFALSLGAVASADLYAPNGNTGFGDAFGGTGQLEITDDGTDLTLTLTRGAGLLNDRFVLYFDSTAGGFGDTTAMLDAQDPGRQGISGEYGANDSDVILPFDADFAMSFDITSGGFLFGLANGGNGSLNFVSQVSPGGVNNNDPTFTFTIPIADLGMTPGDSLSFAGTYLNGGNGFRSDEGFGANNAAGNPGNPSVLTITSAGGSYTTTAVPEPTTLSLLALTGIIALGARRFRTRG